MRSFLTRAAAAASILLAGALAGFLLALYWGKPAGVHKPEPAAPAVIQQDGSLILERVPTTTVNAAPPKAKVPQGAVLERKVHLTVKPHEPAAAANVELSLIRLSDDTRRVVAWSDNAEVGGIDIPLEPILVPAPPKRWAAGLYVNPARPDQYGVFLDRDLGRMRVGAELGRGYAGKAEVRLRVGMTF